MKVLSVGVIGYGVVGKEKLITLLKIKKLKLEFISDIKFKNNFVKKDIKYFKNYLNLIKQNPDVVFVTLPNYLAAKSY